MKYDQIEEFSDEQFRRLTGVKRSLIAFTGTLEDTSSETEIPLFYWDARC